MTELMNEDTESHGQEGDKDLGDYGHWEADHDRINQTDGKDQYQRDVDVDFGAVEVGNGDGSSHPAILTADIYQYRQKKVDFSK